MARCKELITDIRTRLDVAAKLANADVNVEAEIPLDEAAPADITDQVADYFGLNPQPTVAESAPDANGEVVTASFARE